MAKHWIQFAIGLWILISPWLLGFSEISTAKWSNVIVGLILIVGSVWLAFGQKVDEGIL